MQKGNLAAPQQSQGGGNGENEQETCGAVPGRLWVGIPVIAIVVDDVKACSWDSCAAVSSAAVDAGMKASPTDAKPCAAHPKV